MTNMNSYMTVREAVEKKTLSERDCLYVIYLLTIVLKRISDETVGGGHFNINLDTVKVLKEEGKDVRVELEGAENVHESCHGKPDFDTGVLNPCFLPPESFLGRFSPATDVYSLGILLVYMLQGTYPFDINESMSKKEIFKTIKSTKPQLEASLMPELIIKKAISKNAVERYKNVEDLGFAIMVFMGFEKPNNFSCFTGGKKKRKIDDGTTRIGGDHCRLSHNVQEPQINVDMNVRIGEGFNAVAGMEDLKRRLKRDFVDIVSNKELAKVYDIQPPNMLFFGPPGTGKTYISQRLAEQCGLSFCTINPSDLASIWVHGSQQLIRNLFDKAANLAKENKHGCLLLIDEFDAVAPKRTEDDNNHQSGEVAELLTQLNGCIEKNVYVIGTTNFLNRIDKAVIRKGRIDEVVFIGMPDAECRKQIFELELNKRPHEECIDMELLSKLTEGYTSGDISYMVKESARKSFEASIKSEGMDIVKIDQKILEDIIGITKPSVSQEEVRQYERMRDEYIRKNGNERRRIGFLS